MLSLHGVWSAMGGGRGGGRDIRDGAVLEDIVHVGVLTMCCSF